ncbi:MAG TPA: hypothetical protein PLP23_12845 [Panacibacter sp.]|nr:hypothetical protein [Panacibacter sp.]
MKKIYMLILMVTVASSAFATNYPGNGNSGFGGSVGTGSLDVTSDGTNISFKLNRGSGDMENVLVIYIDSKAGGFASTSGFTDAGDGLRKAISGYTVFDNNGGSGRATMNFNSDFNPEYAIAFQPYKNGYTGVSLLVELSNTAHTFISNPDFTNNNTTTATDYTVTINAAQIGLTSSVNFKFIATLISATGYRSNEAIGDPMTGFSQGWNEYTSTVSPQAFDLTLPVLFGGFNGTLKGQSAQLTWNTKTEINCKHFEIQKSNNGTTWLKFATVSAKNNTTGSQYSITDNIATDAKSYYRIKLINLDGSSTYSSIIILRKNGSSAIIDLLGNPVKDVINLNISNDAASVYELALYTMDGRKILSQRYAHPGGSGKVSLKVPGNVRGNCILRISNGTNEQSLKIIVN